MGLASLTSVGGLKLPDVNPQSDLLVGSGNGCFVVVPLLKALFEDWTISRVKTQYLTMLLDRTTTVLCTVTFLKASFLENLPEFGVATAVLAAASL